MKEVTEIRLPEGTFFGNCRDCRYADWNDKDQYTKNNYDYSDIRRTITEVKKINGYNGMSWR